MQHVAVLVVSFAVVLVLLLAAAVCAVEYAGRGRLGRVRRRHFGWPVADYERAFEASRERRRRRELLLADAYARQRGENLDGSPRRETIAFAPGVRIEIGDPLDRALVERVTGDFVRKCKRRRADGPTPCLACPDECEG